MFSLLTMTLHSEKYLVNAGLVVAVKPKLIPPLPLELAMPQTATD